MQNDTELNVNLVLEQLGLSKSEIAVYLCAQQLGAKPASAIAKKSSLKRPQTYNVLASLAHKGLIQEFEKNGVTYYSASTPEALVGHIESEELELRRKKSRVQDLLPYLLKLRGPQAGRTKTKLYQGFDSIKQLHDEILAAKPDAIYGILDRSHNLTHASKGEKEWMKQWILRRVEQGVWYYGIMCPYKEGETAMLSGRNLRREFRRLEGIQLPAEFMVFGDSVAIVSSDMEWIGIVIENASIAQSLRAIHQVLWNTLPEYTIPGDDSTAAQKQSRPDSQAANVEPQTLKLVNG